MRFAAVESEASGGPSADEMTRTKKFLLIGCGGALSLSIIAAVLVARFVYVNKDAWRARGQEIRFEGVADNIFPQSVVLSGLPGLVETVPTFRSLLVHYDPLKTSSSRLCSASV